MSVFRFPNPEGGFGIPFGEIGHVPEYAAVIAKDNQCRFTSETAIHEPKIRVHDIVWPLRGYGVFIRLEAVETLEIGRRVIVGDPVGFDSLLFRKYFGHCCGWFYGFLTIQDQNSIKHRQ